MKHKQDKFISALVETNVHKMSLILLHKYLSSFSTKQEYVC